MDLVMQRRLMKAEAVRVHGVKVWVVVAMVAKAARGMVVLNLTRLALVMA